MLLEGGGSVGPLQGQSQTHHIQKRVQLRLTRKDAFLLWNYCQNKIVKLYQIKEAHNLQAQGRQERVMFFSVTIVRKSYKLKSIEGYP